MATKFRSKFKQKAYESYLRNPEKTTDSFENMWGRSIKTARKLYMGSGRKFKGISEKARVFFQDELFYKDTGYTYNDVLASSKGKNIESDFKDAEKTIYKARTKTFMSNNGQNKIKWGEEEKTLEDFFEDYKNDVIDKDEMNKIIKEYKEKNPDRSLYYANTETNADLQENGFEK